MSGKKTAKFGKNSSNAMEQTQQLSPNKTPSQWHAEAQELLENTALTHKRAAR